MSTSQRNSRTNKSPNLELEFLRSHLESTLHLDITKSSNIPSAVLVIIHNLVDPTVIMTVKPKSMKHHGGQIAFPGGKLDLADDDLLDTALRETREELGLVVERGQVIGQLPSVITQSSGYEITPFVYIADKVDKMVPNSEVDEILCAPLAELFDTVTTSNELGTVFVHGGHTVWGATARILLSLGRKVGVLDG